ncbi:hypothetical protein J2Y55_001944 [Bosea sp. BE125]|nr:hypothetical protein [Bosea sp. BE125]MDR6870936.1 hypothetical protein [Bosea sp. BE125]
MPEAPMLGNWPGMRRDDGVEPEAQGAGSCHGQGRVRKCWKLLRILL